MATASRSSHPGCAEAYWAWISGGAGGLGIAFARALLANGASGVALADLKSSPAVSDLKQQFPHRIVTFSVTDVTDKAAVEKSLLDARDAFGGRLTVIVSNAGTMETVDVQKHFDINLLAPMHVTNFGMDLLAKQPPDAAGFRGCVINISSAAGVLPSEPAPMYTASKSGLVGFTRCFRTSLRETGVSVCALAPGYTETPFIHPPAEHVGAAEVERSIARLGVMQPQQVAEAFLELVQLSQSQSGEVSFYGGVGYLLLMMGIALLSSLASISPPHRPSH